MVLISREAARNFFNQPSLKQCPNILSVFAVSTCCILLILSLLAVTFQPYPVEVHIVLVANDEPAVAVNDERFLSIGLDSSVIADGFRNFHMTSKLLINLMRALGPGYMRVGGTMADRLLFKGHRHKAFTFEIDGGECSYEDKYCKELLRPNFTMSGEEWLSLNKLASETGFVILFDLNCLMRNENGSWNSANAEKLISYSNNYGLEVIWQLGNEPNSFRHVFNYEVNASQLAADFHVLRNILNKYPRYRESLMVGPDTTRPRPENTASEKYLKTFLSTAGDVINATTWHQYYFNGRTASLFDFINPDVFDLLLSQIKIVQSIVQFAGLEKTPVWLTETAAAYGGGSPGYSNRFIGTFIWLDKLGLAAKNSMKVVVRQSIFKGYYALIGDDYEPTPDWWLSVLYKRLVGPTVIPCHILSSRRVRLYCHCAKKSRWLSSETPSAVTVFGINMQNMEAKVRIEGFESYDRSGYVSAYIFSPHISLLSKYVRLNGNVLFTQKGGGVPHLKPITVNANPYLIIPPFSIVFWVIPTDDVQACTK